jgi:hypothetical protein
MAKMEFAPSPHSVSKSRADLTQEPVTHASGEIRATTWDQATAGGVRDSGNWNFAVFPSAARENKARTNKEPGIREGAKMVINLQQNPVKSAEGSGRKPLQQEQC